MEKSRFVLVNIDDQKIVSVVVGGMYIVCLINKGEVGDLLMQLYVYIFVRLGSGLFNVLSVLNVVVYIFNCIYKFRYYLFDLLYDIVYIFVMIRILVFMYIYCLLFYFVLIRILEFLCIYIVYCFRCIFLVVMMRGFWEGIYQKKVQRFFLVRLIFWGGVFNCRREIVISLC